MGLHTINNDITQKVGQGVVLVYMFNLKFFDLPNHVVTILVTIILIPKTLVVHQVSNNIK
jgi:hypothetical protein